MSAPTVIRPTSGPITDSATGWPITASAYVSLGSASVEVALTDPRKDETVCVLDLTPHGAIRLASQLVEVARKVIRGKVENDAGAYLGGVVMVGSKCRCGADADTVIHSDLLGEFDICEPCGLREIERMRSK
jgi:hypothetical protein